MVEMFCLSRKLRLEHDLVVMRGVEHRQVGEVDVLGSEHEHSVSGRAIGRRMAMSVVFAKGMAAHEGHQEKKGLFQRVFHGSCFNESRGRQ